MTITTRDIEEFEQEIEKIRRATGTYGDEFDSFVLGFAQAFIQAKGLAKEYTSMLALIASEKTGKP